MLYNINFDLCIQLKFSIFVENLKTIKVNIMGLDMYLRKKMYLGANYEHNQIGGTVELTKASEPIPVNVNELETLVFGVGYWRKANAIHNWFVQNCQDGVDECQETEVSIEKLKELLGICEKIKEKPKLAPKLLPTTSGFFFGSTDYDELYFQDIDLTIKIIENILESETDSEKNGGIHVDYYYQSSW